MSLEFDIEVALPGHRVALAAEVPGRGITVLSGPSGAGKTTVLRALAGLEPGVRGTVRFNGESWDGLPPEARGIGFVFQDAQLFEHLSVAENIRYGAKRRNVGEAHVALVSKALDLGPLMERRVTRLSGGEARRVALARALAALPRMLFLDEPTAGLDAARKVDVLPYIARAVEEFGIPALYVSHDAGEIAYVADRVLTMDGAMVVPAAVPVRVLGAEAGMLQLGLGGQSFALAGNAAPGTELSLRLGAAPLICARDPGPVAGAVVLCGVTVDMGDGARGLEIEGEQIALEPAAELGIGTQIWLLSSQAALRGL